MKIQKWMAMLLVPIMAAGMSACSQQGENIPSSAGTQPGTSETSVAVETSSEDSTAKEPLTISIGWSRGANIKYAPGESMENNAWTRAYEEQLGYTLDFKMVAVPEQYPQKVALAIASGDLPDLFFASKKNFYLALEGGYCTDLTNLKDSCLTELSKSYVDEYDLPFRAATVDGRLMAFPELNEDPTTDAQLTFIRHDWLEKLGLDVPKTQEEMMNTLIAFAKSDPDGNGQADTFGLGIKKDLWSVNYGLEGFFNSYHAYPNIWYEDDGGKLVYGTVQAEAMKTALTDLARLYQEGAIDREFVVKDSDKVQEDVVSNKIGSMYGRWWTFGGAPTKAFMADPDKVTDRWWCVESVSVDDQPVMLQSSSSAPNSFLIANSKFEHPEALFDFVNIWFELMFKPGLTEEDFKTYTVAEDYSPQDYAFAGGWWPYVNPRVDNIQGVNAGTIDPATLTGESKVIWDNITAFQEKNYYQAAYDHYWNHSFLEHSSMDIRWKVFERGGTVSDLSYGPSTETMQEKMSTLEKLRDEVIVQIITGEKPVEEFDAFIANWYQLGGQEIVDEMNTWYAEQKAG